MIHRLWKRIVYVVLQLQKAVVGLACTRIIFDLYSEPFNMKFISEKGCQKFHGDVPSSDVAIFYSNDHTLVPQDFTPYGFRTTSATERLWLNQWSNPYDSYLKWKERDGTKYRLKDIVICKHLRRKTPTQNLKICQKHTWASFWNPILVSKCAE